MQSQGGLSELDFKDRLKEFFVGKWNNLSNPQKNYASKIWGVLTYKWRWQVAMNIPYLVVFILDRTVPAVHQFDRALLASITSKLPIPDLISSWFATV